MSLMVLHLGFINHQGQKKYAFYKLSTSRSHLAQQQVQFPGSTYATAPYALHLEPGQILPRKATLSEPRKLEQTPYHRQHHYSISNPDTFTYQPLPETRRGRRGRHT